MEVIKADNSLVEWRRLRRWRWKKASGHWLSLTGASAYIDCRVVKTHRRTYSTMFACFPVINQSLCFLCSQTTARKLSKFFHVWFLLSVTKEELDNKITWHITKSYSLKGQHWNGSEKRRINIKSTTTCCSCCPDLSKTEAVNYLPFETGWHHWWNISSL